MACANPTSAKTSARAIILGAICVLVLGLLIPYSDLKLQGTWIACCHLPIGVFVLQFLLIVVLNSALRLALPRFALRAGELITVYAMMLVGSGIPSFGLTEYLFPTLAGLRYFASPENKWETTFFQHVPGWIAPRDPKVVTDFFEGLHPGERIPWEAWLTPMLAWTALALIVFFLMACVSSIFRRQWIENEHLIFPLVQLPLDMVDELETGVLPPFFRNKFMWVGAAVPLIIHSWNGLSRYFPALPAIPLSRGLNQYIRGRPWNRVGMLIIWCHFSIIGFSYLLSSELSFSLWFFFALFNLESVALAAMGIEVPPIPNYPTRAEAALQMLGAFFVIFGYMVYLVRGHLGEMLEAVSSNRRSGILAATEDPASRLEAAPTEEKGPRDASMETRSDAGEPLSYPATIWGIIAGTALFTLWCSQAGMAVWFSLSSLGLFLVTALVLTRLVSEGGLLFIQAPFRPTDIYQTFVGLRWVPARSLVAASFTERVFMFDLRTFLMPSLMDSYKLAHETRLNMRKLMPALGIAVVVAIAASYYSALATCYKYGAVTLSSWFCLGSPQQPFTTLVSWIDAPKAANPTSIVFVLIGVAITIGLSIARVRFTWWPFHPLGYAMGPSWPLIQIWFSIFVGWLMKMILMRYGSGRTYRKARPLFLGLVAGEFLAAGIWVVVSAVTGTRGHRFFLT